MVFSSDPFPLLTKLRGGWREYGFRDEVEAFFYAHWVITQEVPEDHIKRGNKVIIPYRSFDHITDSEEILQKYPLEKFREEFSGRRN